MLAVVNSAAVARTAEQDATHWARKEREARDKKQAAMAQMRAEGASLRKIAAAVGVTHPTAELILRKMDEDA